eukprot:Gb_19081 [translate_table: standard]
MYSDIAWTRCERRALNVPGALWHIVLIAVNVRVVPPSTIYVAIVQGAPTKPNTAALLPTSLRKMLRDSPTNWSFSNSI